jgi:excinuclease UvrABC helicase subunit UvrB
MLVYADKLTEAIQGALEQTNCRRAVQLAYNEELLRFEYAAKLRDEIKDLRRELQALEQAAA